MHRVINSALTASFPEKRHPGRISIRKSGTRSRKFGPLAEKTDTFLLLKARKHTILGACGRRMLVVFTHNLAKSTERGRIDSRARGRLECRGPIGLGRPRGGRKELRMAGLGCCAIGFAILGLGPDAAAPVALREAAPVGE